jgi:hypothetical protein
VKPSSLILPFSALKQLYHSVTRPIKKRIAPIQRERERIDRGLRRLQKKEMILPSSAFISTVQSVALEDTITNHRSFNAIVEEKSPKS